MCPVWDVHGFCPVGLNCRWARSHVTEELTLKTKPEEEQVPIIEVWIGDGDPSDGRLMCS